MKYITKEVRIGIAGIAALCILVYGINYLKGIHMFKPSNYFYVQFQNINGLPKSPTVSGWELCVSYITITIRLARWWPKSMWTLNCVFPREVRLS